jgi:hypothetical protein
MVYLAIMPSDSLVSNVSRLIVTWPRRVPHEGSWQ